MICITLGAIPHPTLFGYGLTLLLSSAFEHTGVLLRKEVKKTLAHILFMDFWSIFSTPTCILLQKLRAVFVNPSLRNWLWDFLTDRKQWGKINNSISTTTTTNSGTPQGCVSSPALFYVPSIISHQRRGSRKSRFKLTPRHQNLQLAWLDFEHHAHPEEVSQRNCFIRNFNVYN